MVTMVIHCLVLWTTPGSFHMLWPCSSGTCMNDGVLLYMYNTCTCVLVHVLHVFGCCCIITAKGVHGGLRQ